MRNYIYILFAFFLFSTSTILPAQDTPEAQSINEGSIEDQFEFAIKKSNNYTDGNGRSYEVIRRTMMLDLKKNTLDSITAIKNRLDNSTAKVETQQQEINTLKTDFSDTQETLSTTQKEKDSMNLLGLQMSKTGYNLLMWSLIAGLLGLLLFFIFKFKYSNEITKSAKANLVDLENEFKEHRKTALEREQKVKRELQDYINKHGG